MLRHSLYDRLLTRSSGKKKLRSISTATTAILLFLFERFLVRNVLVVEVNAAVSYQCGVNRQRVKFGRPQFSEDRPF